MLYHFVRPLAAIAIKTNFRKIYLSNTDRIPKDKPVILAANHPTAFMEPCILACFLDRPLYFLVRGDFFKKPLFAYLLRKLHMLPVYRMRDGGYKNLKNNYSTFESCAKALKENKTIMILAEGTAIHEKRLRPIQKGCARIALGALNHFPNMEDIYIVPVGVNYTYADRPRSQVMIDFGAPILAKDYWAQYEENPQLAITKLTNRIRETLEKRVVIVEVEEDERFAEHLFQLNRNSQEKQLSPTIESDIRPLKREKELADRINHLPQAIKTAQKKKVQNYFGQLKELGIKDWAVVNAQHYHFGQIFWLALGFLPFLGGFILNIIPAGSGKLISDTFVKAIEFHAPVRVSASIGTYLIYFLVLGVLSIVYQSWWLLTLTIISYPLGLFTLYYWEFFTNWRRAIRFKGLSNRIRERIQDQRKELIEEVRS